MDYFGENAKIVKRWGLSSQTPA